MKSLFQNIFLFLSIFFFGLLLGSTAVSAQQVSFTAHAPKVVSIGEQFRLIYTVNTRGAELKPRSFDGFSVLSGPNSSTSTSVQIINGQMQQSMSVSYTYILRGQKAGKFIVNPGSITVEGKEYKSKPLAIEVVKGQASAQRQTNRSGNANMNTTDPAASIKSDDLFIRLLVSKREVLKGEPVIATLKLYTKINLANLGNFKAPAFNGFWSEFLRKAQNIKFQRENVNNQVYNTSVIQQHVLIPERTGVLTIEGAELTAIAQLRVQKKRSRSVFGQLFNSIQNVEKVLSSPPITLKVNPLPSNAPAGYSGAVGKINLTASVDPKEVKTNEAITLKVSYSGTGNLKLLEEPSIKFPSDFEVYDPKIANSYSASGKGFSGKKTFEYLMIPRHEGDFEIPTIQFSGFDLDTKTYSTQSAGPFSIHVEKGEGGEIAIIDPRLIKEDVLQLGSDIRYIKTNEFSLRKKDRPFWGSASFYLSYVFSIGLFSLAFFVVRRQRKQNEDEVYMKNKKAGRFAKSRLKQAKAFMEKGERSNFYNEVLNAQWGYLSDKLNIPQGELNKEKIRNCLAALKMDEKLINEYLELMNRCEFAQFAPVESADELTDVYNITSGLFGKMEKAFTEV